MCLVAAPIVLIAVAAVYERVYPYRLQSLFWSFVIRQKMLSEGAIDIWADLCTRVQPLDDSHVAIGRGTNLVILEFRDSQPEVCAQVPGLGIIHDLYRQGGTLYAAKGMESLVWYDVRKPCQARRLGRYILGGYGFGLEVIGDRLFLADRSGGLTEFDVTVPARPVFRRFVFGKPDIENPVDAEWMTSDVAEFHGQPACADGAQGLVLVGDLDQKNPRVRSVLASVLTRPLSKRNVDPAPLKVATWGDYLYLVMRDQGLAVLRGTGMDDVELLRVRRFDDSETTDATVADDRLYLSDTGGRVRVFGLERDPGIEGEPIAQYGLPERGAIHSLAVDEQRLYVSAVGSGLTVIPFDAPQEPKHWIPPAKVQGIAVFGDTIVSAEGTGGVAVYRWDGEALQPADRRYLPSLVYSVTPMDDTRVAVSADVSGTWCFRLNEDGTLVLESHIPTPEHAFSAAVSSTGDLATANGVYGVLQYRASGPPEAPVWTEVGTRRLSENYSTRVQAWWGGFVGLSFVGPIIFTEPKEGPDPSQLPSRCTKSAVSDGGDRLVIACGGRDISILRPGLDGWGEQSLKNNVEVNALALRGEELFVGGYPAGINVFHEADHGWERSQSIETTFPVYDFQPGQGGLWVAAGTQGIRRLEKTKQGWQWREIRPVAHDQPPSSPPSVSQ